MWCVHRQKEQLVFVLFCVYVWVWIASALFLFLLPHFPGYSLVASIVLCAVRGSVISPLHLIRFISIAKWQWCGCTHTHTHTEKRMNQHFIRSLTKMYSFLFLFRKLVIWISTSASQQPIHAPGDKTIIYDLIVGNNCTQAEEIFGN